MTVKPKTNITFRWSVLATLCVTFLVYCTKKDVISDRTESHPFLKMDGGLDQRLDAIRDSLAKNVRQSMLDSIVVQYGLPDWEKGLLENKAAGYVAVVPINRAKDRRISAFIAFDVAEKFRFKLYDVAKRDTYGNNNGEKVANSRSVFVMEQMLNVRSFDAPPEAMSDPCIMTRSEQNQLDRLRSERKAGPIGPFQMHLKFLHFTSCYTWTACAGDGNGNCIGIEVYHQECIGTTIWVPDTPNDDKPFSGVNGDQNSSPGVSDGGVNPNTYQPSAGNCHSTGTDSEMSMVLPPDKPVTNLAQYMGCFSNTAPGKLIFYADQPLAGSADAFSVKEKAGHAYIAIEQTINGTIYRRSIGFHPKQGVSPFFPDNEQSQLGDDSNQPFDVSLQVNLSAAQLLSVLQKVSQHSPVYNLESYNCTHFVYDIAGAAGVNIPKTNGWWIFGSGLNPGSFGEDLKKCVGARAQPGISSPNIGSCN